MANTPEQTRANLERVQKLLEEIKTDAKDAAAHASSDGGYMLSIYEEILSVVSPIVVRATARLEREELSGLRKSLKTHRNGRKSATP